MNLSTGMSGEGETMNAITPTNQTDEQFAIIEQVVISGDLAKLSPQQRTQYYHRVCESIGLNPLTQPFAYITLNGKLTLYVKKDATEQLRKLHGISITNLQKDFAEDLYIVTATAIARDGRTDQATGAVTIANLKGEAKANAIMKAETKSKRRVTLSIAGLGWLDETEVDSIAGAQRVYVDSGTGEIVNNQQRQLPAPKPELINGNGKHEPEQPEPEFYIDAKTGDMVSEPQPTPQPAERCLECHAPAGKPHTKKCSKSLEAIPA